MKLSELFKDKSTDPLVNKVWNSFYDDLENGGFRGAQRARKLYRTAKEARDIAKNTLTGEKALDKFPKRSQDDIRALRDLESKINYKFVDNVDALTASRELDKLSKFNLDHFVKDLNRAVDPKNTKYLQQKYSNLLGEDKAKELFDEIVSHRIGTKVKGGIKAGLGVGSAAAVGNLVVKKVTGR
jgi:hypothetical protein